MGSEFHRIKRLPPYVFSEVNQLKLAARALGKDIIDFGMGNPDMPTPTHILDKMQETLKNPKTHGYSASRGINGLRKAVATFYARRFSVEIDPVHLHLLARLVLEMDGHVLTILVRQGFHVFVKVQEFLQALVARSSAESIPSIARPFFSVGFF